MYVESGCARVHILNTPDVKHPTAPGITYKIVPGAGPVEIPDAFEEHPMFQQYVKDGEIKVVDNVKLTKPPRAVKEEEAPAEDKPLAEMGQRELIAYAKSKNIEIPGAKFKSKAAILEYISTQELLG